MKREIIEEFWTVVDTVASWVLTLLLLIIRRTPSDRVMNSWRQFVRFCIVGFSNVAVSYLINVSTLFLIRDFYYKYDYIIANTTAFVLSVIWSFFMNSRFVFSEGSSERNNGMTFLRTFLSYSFSGVILNNVLSTVWIRMFNISKYFCPILNPMFTIPINFLINKKWAYKIR